MKKTQGTGLDLGNEARDIKELVTNTLVLVVLLMEPSDSINVILCRRDVMYTLLYHGQGLNETDLSGLRSCRGSRSRSIAPSAPGRILTGAAGATLYVFILWGNGKATRWQ
jgi:hypothetical protein